MNSPLIDKYESNLSHDYKKKYGIYYTALLEGECPKDKCEWCGLVDLL